MSNILEFRYSFGPYTLEMKKSKNKDEGSKQLSPLRYKLLLGHLSNALRSITDNEKDNEKKRQLTEYIKALAIALLGCFDLPMSQPKNDEQEKQLSLSVLNSRRAPQPEYLNLRLEENYDQKHDRAVFLSENPKFGKIIKLISKSFKIQSEVEQPNLCIVAASLGIMAIGNLTEKDVSDIIIDALQSHENILKEQINVRLE